MTLYGVAPADIERIWPDILPFVESGMKYLDRYGIDDIKTALLTSEMQLFVAMTETIQGICITRIEVFPKCKVLNIFLVAGKDRNNWLHFDEVLSQWAKELGCKYLEAYCRRGWEKVLDWKHTKSIMVKII